MASRNRLLGSAPPPPETEPVPEIPPGTYTPSWLYSADCPEGRIIRNDAEYLKLLNDGWADTPAMFK